MGRKIPARSTINAIIAAIFPNFQRLIVLTRANAMDQWYLRLCGGEEVHRACRRTLMVPSLWATPQTNKP